MAGSSESQLPRKRFSEIPALALSYRDASHPNSCQVQSFIEKNKVGVRAGAQRAFFELDAQKSCRIQCKHADCISQRSAQRHYITERTIQRESATGKCAFGVATHAANDRYFDVAQ